MGRHRDVDGPLAKGDGRAQSAAVIVSAINVDLSRMSEIKVPVLLVYPGPTDRDISRQGQEQEAGNYSGSADVTTAWLDSGHFPELEGCAPAFRALSAHWLHERWRIG